MSNRKTFIKWAGGKEKELPIILKNLPSNFTRYVEPFVGGGAVYLNINCPASVINDKSDELILLYKLSLFSSFAKLLGIYPLIRNSKFRLTFAGFLIKLIDFF